MAENKIPHIVFIVATCSFIFSACDITSNLPQDETLYAGIHELAYDAAPKNKRQKTEDDEGVITALADAYSTVEGLLTGDASVISADGTDAKEMRALQKIQNEKDQKQYDATREEIEAVLSFAPNGSVMGSSYTRWPYPLRLWIYNRYLNARHRWGRWMFNTFASTPRYVSTANPSVRTQVARNTLKNFGYFRGTAAFDTVPLPLRRQAKIAYEVHPGPLFHLDSIQYLGFQGAADSMLHATMWASHVVRGNPFDVAKLDAERQRISTLLRNNGYYYFQPGYVAFRADTLQRPLKVQLQVCPRPDVPTKAQKVYHLRNTIVTLQRYNERQNLTDSLGRRRFKMYFRGDPKPPLRPGAILHQMNYRPGDLYRQESHELMQKKLAGMGIFSQVRVNYTPADSTENCDSLDVRITAMLDKPYDAEFEGKVTTKSNGQVGPGATFAVSKANAFRGAETAGIRLWGSYEWQTGANLRGKSSLLNSYEYGVNAYLTYPRILFFNSRKLSRRAVSSTKFQLDSRWLNRAGYFGRVSLGARVTYSYKRRPATKHEFTPFRLDYDVKLHSTARFDSIVAANQALYVSMRNQFVPSMEYLYTWVSQRHAPRTFTLNLKEAGNFASAIYALGGQSFERRDKQLFGVPFAQFLKTTAQYTHKFRLTRRSCIATRVVGGLIFCYGNSTSAPYSDLFSVGGANSIRAFAVRSIGPGSYQPANSNYSYIDETGDIKFEANAEYRFPLVANLYGAVFLDAGNVWLMKPNADLPGGAFSLKNMGREIALGTGAGLRYDLDFLVIRFDIGVGIHAPYDTGRSGYYNMTRFGKSLGYHLAVGYPF